MTRPPRPSTSSSSSNRGGGSNRAPQRSSSRRAEKKDTAPVPQIYQDMLIEISSSSSGVEERRKRPVKRRKVGERIVVSVDSGDGEEIEEVGGGKVPEKLIQTTYVSDGSDESDMEWEEVDLQQQSNTPVQTQPGTPAVDDDEPLQLTLGNSSEKGKSRAPLPPPRRKPVTAAERRWRLVIHKVHLLCLLSHVQIRNLWCNDDDVQQFFSKKLNKNTVMCLNPREDRPQFTRSTTFIDGLNQASEVFRRSFKVTAPGMRRPYWADGNERKEAPLHDSEEIILSKSDFISQAKLMSGSRDFGAQVFCAMLRSVGVEARLVCSLQVLPFTGVARGMISVEPKPMIVVSEDGQVESSTPSADLSKPASRSTTAAPPSKVRRLGRPSFGNKPVHSPKGKQKLGHSPSIQTSPYPVFWVEAFNEPVQKWIPVDPLVTKTVAKPSKFEPPASDRYNNMSYVIAFEDDASARDVTRRYTKSYNAKTRKTRVESTKDGETWWETAMQFFERPFMEDRDQLELGDLTSRSAAEPMPRNIQDFKDHPVYALERHLHRNQVIHPKRVVGQVGVGKPGSSKGGTSLEQVYRRGDVKTVKSADGWYRLGRDVKAGEQPLKRVPAKRSRTAERIEEDDDPGSEAPLTPLYAAYQTDLYKPPAVVDGRVPKNVYGNLDVYVQSMVPPGGVHIRHDEAARAARILGIHYADAVTGFEFKGRQGTAVTKGIVAATEYREAILEVISCLEDERAQAEEDRRTTESLRMWKHLLIKLRVIERVKGYIVEGQYDEESADASIDDDEDYGGGGFLPEVAEDTAPRLAISLRSEPQPDLDEDNGADSELEDAEPPPIKEDVSSPSLPVPPPAGNIGGSGEGLGSAASMHGRGFVSSKQQQQRYTLIVRPNETGSSSKGKNPDRTASSPPAPPIGNNQTDRSDPIDLEEVPQEWPIITAVPGPLGEGTASDPTIVDTSSEGKSNSVEEVEAVGLSETAPKQESDSDSMDQSSMLSHDPEDEDAEPEWLLSD